MVLYHVLEQGRLVVVADPRPDVDRLCDDDLDVADVVSVPERLPDHVTPPECEDVHNGLLREVVVDSVDVLLPELLVQVVVEGDRAFVAPSERLLDDDPHPAAAVRYEVAVPELGRDRLDEDSRVVSLVELRVQRLVCV